MTKTEIENKIYDLKRVIEGCKNVIKANENEIKKLEAEKEKPAFERLKKGEGYYSIRKGIAGEFISDLLTEENTSFDKNYFENNNYFHTKERAEEVADKINFLLKLERLHDTFCPDYKPDWNDGATTKWCVVFDYGKKEYISCWNTFIDNHATVYFDSKETTEKVCDILNKELENEDKDM